MENRINHKLYRLEELCKRRGILNSQLQKSLSKSDKQAIRLNLKQLDNRIRNTLQDIKDYVSLPLLEIEYSLNNQPYLARLPMKQDEALTLLNFLSNCMGDKITIHSIKCIPTFLSKPIVKS